MTLTLYNTLTRRKEPFRPIDPGNVRMYVCGPTVYDFAHIGNARPVIVFDVLFRLLRHLYGADHVTYARNITDVDDKINARAAEQHPNLELNEAIRKVTEATTRQFHEDVAALGALPPTHEPRATEFVLPRRDRRADMKTLIQKLLDRGNAYVAVGDEGKEVLFDVASMPDYGALSQRHLEDQKAGARVAVEAHKKNSEDFVLWKESGAKEPGWKGEFKFMPNPKTGYDAEFSISPENASQLGLNSPNITIHGRPGWHIECSAMSAAYLGEIFDIHGGGLDLIFPHHENEIAQSRCAHGTAVMANVWMHNGFLQVEGEKMSKSLGNFVTINELLATERFGGWRWPGEVLRFAMLSTHYRQPIDWTAGVLEEARRTLNTWSTLSIGVSESNANADEWPPDQRVIDALSDDLNTPEAIAVLHSLASGSPSEEQRKRLFASANWLGLLRRDKLWVFATGAIATSAPNKAHPVTEFQKEIRQIRASVANTAGLLYVSKIAPIEAEIRARGWTVKTDTDGFLSFSPLGETRDDRSFTAKVDALRDARNAARKARDFKEADRIRDELTAMGIQLKDAKDPATGEIVTTWEVKR